MIEDIMEIFMDNFSVFGKSFESCLTNLKRVLTQCIEVNLVLNWDKCHFMVNSEIVLGQKILEAEIKVDQAKLTVIKQFTFSNNITDIKSFLGHVGFYCRFIRDFSKISKSLCCLLEKDVKFQITKECEEAFLVLKDKLSSAPIIITPY